MSNPEQRDDWNDDQPEITSLDPKVEGFVAGSIKPLLQFRQKMRNSPRLRASDGSPIYHFHPQYYWWAPVIDNSMIYADIGFASVQARSARDGSLVWQYRGQGNGLWHAIVESGVVYISAPGGSIKALRGQDGALLWQYEAKAVISPPVVYSQLAYLTWQDGGVVAVRTSDGVPLWHWRPSTPSGGSVPPLVVSDGIVYINLDAPGGIVYALQASTGQVLWYHALSTTTPSYLPVASDGVLYLGTDDRSIEAWRGSDGHFLWRYASPAPLEWYPEVDNSILLVRPLNGTLDVFRIVDGKLLWRYP